MSIKAATSRDFTNREFNQVEHVTAQKIGKEKSGLDVLPRALFPVQILPESSEAGSNKTMIVNSSGLIKVGDILRFTQGNNLGIECSVLEVDGNDIYLGTMLLEDPSVSGEFIVMRHITLTLDSNGALSTSQGPVQYILDGVTQQVIEDTADPSNNRVLPTGAFIVVDGNPVPLEIDTADQSNTVAMPSSFYYMRDGQITPVIRDTVTPSNTRPIPVELVDISGVPVNIDLTTGDLNIVLSHDGVARAWDSSRIGDGTNLVRVKPDAGDAGYGAAKVVDEEAIIELQNIVDKLTGAPATEPKQDSIIIAINSLLDELKLKADRTDIQPVSLASSPLPTGAATEAKQDDIITALGPLATEAKQDSLITAISQSRAFEIKVSDYLQISPTTAGYTEIVASTGAFITRKLSLYWYAGTPLWLAIGGAGAEVDYLVIPKGGFAGEQIEVTIPANSRLSVKAIGADAPANTEMIINLMG